MNYIIGFLVGSLTTFFFLRYRVKKKLNKVLRNHDDERLAYLQKLARMPEDFEEHLK